jgi:hypothetical protein
MAVDVTQYCWGRIGTITGAFECVCGHRGFSGPDGRGNLSADK